MFSSLGVLQHVHTAHQTQRQPEAGLFVVAKTKLVEQIGNVMLSQDPNLVPPETSSETPQQRARAVRGWPEHQHVNTQDESTIEIQMLPRPSREPPPHIHSPLAQTLKEVAPEPVVQPQSLSKCRASIRSRCDQVLPAPTQTPVALKYQKGPVLSKHVTSPVPEEEGSSSSSQTSTWKPRGQPNTVRSAKTSPQPPVMIHSEVHSKAQSMARSRLEKARFRLQARIQQAITLFGGKEMSESQAKRKQVHDVEYELWTSLYMLNKVSNSNCDLLFLIVFSLNLTTISCCTCKYV